MLSTTAASNPQESALYTSAAVFLLGAIALVVQTGYSLGAALLFAGGVYSLFSSRKLELSRDDALILGVLVAFGLVHILDMLMHQAGSRYLDKPTRFILATLAFALVRKYPPRMSWLWAGLALGGILTALWAGYQKLFLQMERALGYTHVIQFGNIAMLTGLFCLAGLGWANAHRRRHLWVPLLLAGAIGGVLGSLLSGSRGGWIGLPLVFLVLCRAYSDFFSTRLKIAIPTLMVVSAVGIYHVPQLGVQDRVHAAFDDIRLYRDGDSDTSLGARFEMWRGAGQLILRKPLLGWGEINYDSAMRKLVAQDRADEIVTDFGHPHNEVLNAAAKRGLPGLLALLALYFVPLRLFARGLRSPDMTQRSLAAAGTLLPVAYIDFGLSQAFFVHNSGVMIYAFWLVVFWGCYRNASDGPAGGSGLHTRQEANAPEVPPARGGRPAAGG